MYKRQGLKIGVAVSYETEHLPVLTQWRCTRSGEYALGIEPSNNEISGMQNERHEGRSMPIPAGSRHRFRLALRDVYKRQGRNIVQMIKR